MARDADGSDREAPRGEGRNRNRGSGRDTPFVVPREAIYFLLLQRSRYRWQPLYRLFSLVGLGGVYKQRITRSFIEARRAEVIGRKYQRDVNATLDLVKDHLPTGLEAAVDVGGGIGGLCLALWRRYPASLKRLYLLDRSEVSPEYYTGFEEKAAFYNSLAVGRRFLLENGVPDEVIRTVDAARDPFPPGPLDLVISTLAWGFHFPVSTYVEEARAALKPHGVVILHIRKETDGEEVLAQHFREVERIDEARRSHLVVARGPRS
jgi:SAM-dependent methyltransferase